jgi:hypothetical protein
LVCRTGYVSAGHDRGLLPEHAAAVVGELGWFDRRWRERLYCDLRPRACRFVSLGQVADLARLVPGCRTADEDGDTLQLTFTSDVLQRAVAAAPAPHRRYGHSPGCGCGCNPRPGPNDDLVADVAPSGHMRARIRTPIDSRDGVRRPATFSGSRPELAGWVLAELTTAASIAREPAAVSLLYTSEVLL